jgi:broad specificity phosphatase PhoE
MDVETRRDSPQAVSRIYLVRHGRTAMNTEVRFRGRRDVPLDSVGRAEALAVSQSLGHVGLEAVYSSPLSRAREVAIAIAAVAGLATFDDIDGLVNVDYGSWEGLTKEECAERDPDAFRLYAEAPDVAVCPDGEALAAAADRIVAALREIGGRHPGQAVAAVTHGVMVRLAVLRTIGSARGDWQFELPTGSATVFDVSDTGVRLASVIDRTRPDPVKAAAGDVEQAAETIATGR